MPYLIPKDYSVLIQEQNILQIISNDESVRSRAQLAGEAEAQSYLKQKYDISQEFKNTNQWDKSFIYKAYDRVYLDANTYVQANNYIIGDFTVNAGHFYTCTTNTTGVFNPLHWLLIAPQYTIYYAQYPYPPFEYSKFYNVGDNVFWKNSIYKTKIATQVINHNAALQYSKIEDLPLINIAPDDPNTGDEYWQFISNYNIPANTNINNTTYWTKGDNRDPQMVLYLTDIVLYHLHTRIAPRNIPEIRVKRYDNAIDWLKMCAEGDVTPNLPLLQPKQGNRIRYGGNIKLINI